MELSKKEAEVLEKAYKMMLNGHNEYRPETEAAISDFENRYGAIPSEYRYVLAKYGGCYFTDPWIYTLKELSCEITRSYEHDNIISNDNVFPVGGLGDGSTVCIMKETGQIAILPHDVYVETIDDLEIIANSFKDLILDLASGWIEVCKQINN